MPTKLLVPRLGEGVDELMVVRWLKNEGEPVRELEPLLEVETDKVVTEIPSPASGVVLKISIPENTPARVGEVMAWIGEAGESLEVDMSADAGADERMKADSVLDRAKERDTGTRDTGFLSPVVRKISAEHGVDLSQVRGTGLHGRITKQDVVQFLESREQGAGSGQPAPAHVQPATSDIRTPAGDQLIKHSTIRKQIAERMVMSKHTSPHVLTVMEADMSRVVKHRTENKLVFARDGVNLTFTAYFMQAIAAGLKAYPVVNSSWTDEGLLIHSPINIGMATSLGEEGLIVPVIKGADGLSLLGMARAVNTLAERARAKRLTPEDVKGGTFTLTNHGVSGSLFAFPVINQPQCGILGVGAMQKRPVVVTDADGNDSIAIRPMVYLSFVFDHRILDGASADAFLMIVKKSLETWT